MHHKAFFNVDSWLIIIMLFHIQIIKVLKAISLLLRYNKSIKGSLIKIMFSFSKAPPTHSLKIIKINLIQIIHISLAIDNSRFSNNSRFSINSKWSNNSNNTKWCNFFYKNRTKAFISRINNRILKITQATLIIYNISNITLAFQEVEFMEIIIIRHQDNHLQCYNTYKIKVRIQRLSNY